MTSRQLAPITAPPPPKPPQLNLVASALMPDVDTDTFAPNEAPALVAAGWDHAPNEHGRFEWHRPPGDTVMRERAEYRNGLIAAIESMTDVQQKQVEEEAGVTVDSLPSSIFAATADSRWTGGFAYAPENQYAAILADTCNGNVDLPAIPPPVIASAVPSNAGGTLAAAAYDYEVTAVNANGETLASSPVAATVLTGTTGSVTLRWTDAAASRVTRYNIYGRVSGSLGLIGTTTGLTFVDTGAVAPGAAAPGTNTTGGPGQYGNLPIVAFVPFLIKVEDECTSFGWQKRDFVGRALRLLDNATPNALERELWTGAFAQSVIPDSDDASNAFFMQSGTPSAGGSTLVPLDLTPGAGPPSVTRGIQILEDYLANAGFGGQGMLHVAPETSPNLLGARRLGSLLLSVMDNIIVPGSGYPTSGPSGPGGNTPAAGTAWLYATDLVSVRLDAPMVFPSSLAEAFDRGTDGEPNTIRFRAQRFGAATWDGSRLAAVRVTLAT